MKYLLGRQFKWNVKSYFLQKIFQNLFQNAAVVTEALRVNTYLTVTQLIEILQHYQNNRIPEKIQ